MRVTDVRHPRCIVGHEHLRIPAEAEQTMGMPVAHAHHWTVDDVWALPETPGERYEIVDGELLVSAAPSSMHQRAVRELLTVLHAYAKASRVGEALPAPFDVVMADDTLTQPDVCVMPPLSPSRHDNARTRPLPLLALEVLSPSTARFDRIVKRLRYQRAGVEYWIVDLDARLIERWTPDADRPEICSEQLAWQPLGAATALEIDLEALMRDILEDRA